MNETNEARPRPCDAVLGGKQQQPETAYLEPTDFDAKRFAELILYKRGRRGLKDTAKEIGIRPSAISRAEKMHVKNRPLPARLHFEDFLALCNWLGISPAELVTTPALQKILAASGGPQPRPYDLVLGGNNPPEMNCVPWVNPPLPSD